MKKTVDSYYFINEFNSRLPNQFTYEGLESLYDYFDDYEKSTGEEIELDVIAICCDYAEYSKDELVMDYGHLGDSLEAIIEAIREESYIIDVPNGNYIVRAF